MRVSDVVCDELIILRIDVVRAQDLRLVNVFGHRDKFHDLLVLNHHADLLGHNLVPVDFDVANAVGEFFSTGLL